MHIVNDLLVAEVTFSFIDTLGVLHVSINRH